MTRSKDSSAHFGHFIGCLIHGWNCQERQAEANTLDLSFEAVQPRLNPNFICNHNHNHNVALGGVDFSDY
jgi:hypothetical protein